MKREHGLKYIEDTALCCPEAIKSYRFIFISLHCFLSAFLLVNFLIKYVTQIQNLHSTKCCIAEGKNYAPELQRQVEQLICPFPSCSSSVSRCSQHSSGM